MTYVLDWVNDELPYPLRTAAGQGGWILPIAVHPWIISQPHRIRVLERLLTDLARRPGVWPATASEVLRAFTSHRGPAA